MKVLIAADLHNFEFDDVIDIIHEAAPSIDFAIALGDNGHKLEEFADLCQENNILVYSVLGNHDYENYHDNVIDVHGRIEINEATNTSIVGCQGSILYHSKMSSDIVMTQTESLEFFSNLKTADIVISHDGPWLQVDSYGHIGSQGLTKYIEDKKPKLVFHGHYHRNESYMKHNTLVYACYGIIIYDDIIDEFDVIWEGDF